MGASINIRDNKIALLHTVVPGGMSGKGIASASAGHALHYARDNNKLVMVYCPFVADYVKRHPEVKKLLNKEFFQ